MENVFVWKCLEITAIKVGLIDDNDNTKHIAAQEIRDHNKI